MLKTFMWYSVSMRWKLIFDNFPGIVLNISVVLLWLWWLYMERVQAIGGGTLHQTTPLSLKCNRYRSLGNWDILRWESDINSSTWLVQRLASLPLKGCRFDPRHWSALRSCRRVMGRLNQQWLGTPLPDPKFRTAWCGCPMEGSTTYGLYSLHVESP